MDIPEESSITNNENQEGEIPKDLRLKLQNFKIGTVMNYTKYVNGGLIFLTFGGLKFLTFI